jgi:hypothetical protein
MWARVVEVMVGCWLGMSPFIFGHMRTRSAWVDLSAAAAVAALALLSFWSRSRHAHALNGAVGLTLAATGYLTSGDPPSAAAQNQLLVGLVLLMLAIVPNEASRPPRSWQAALPRSPLVAPQAPAETPAQETPPAGEERGMPARARQGSVVYLRWFSPRTPRSHVKGAR